VGLPVAKISSPRVGRSPWLSDAVILIVWLCCDGLKWSRDGEVGACIVGCMRADSRTIMRVYLCRRARLPASPGRPIMKLIAIIIGAALLTAAPFSLQGTPRKAGLHVDRADARVVHRRRPYHSYYGVPYYGTAVYPSVWLPACLLRCLALRYPALSLFPRSADWRVLSRV
jgi:hypothetical protein